MNKGFFYFTLFYLIFHKSTLLFCRKKKGKSNNMFYPFITFIIKNVSKNRKRKSKNKICANILNYNISIPNNWKLSNVNINENTVEIDNFPLNDYSIISIDYGYSFMGLCILSKSKYIYEKIMSRHKNLIYSSNFDLPIKKNVVLFYAVHFKSYIYNFFSFFHYLFEFIYNSNILVIIGCNGLYKNYKREIPHMNKLASDIGRHICYFMNEINGKREKYAEKVSFEVRDELITLKKDDIYKREQISYFENYKFFSNGTKLDIKKENANNTLNFSLKNMVTKVKDDNNTLFSKFYNRNCKNRRDSLSSCYLLHYFLKYYERNQNFFLLPSRNVNYIFHMKK
ncbi:conserved Plasmodium protein, unknown function [Plasmodium malariae]|uniref:Uncharacterized protein n=2 Tax=Plasmodium malariae TaxID=5858 RepID=A0A1C3KZR2_PLAMA|nr:conserved Plasmodium protein, unknown function [Plasmodium malariae]